jgi:hypothetical protein
VAKARPHSPLVVAAAERRNSDVLCFCVSGVGFTAVLVGRAECICDPQARGALGKRHPRDAAGFFGYCRRVLRVMAHATGTEFATSVNVGVRPIANVATHAE